MTPTTPVAVVLAAGKGVRVGSDIPKQFLELDGRPVVVHALEQHVRLGHYVVLVVSSDRRAEIDAILDRHLNDADISIVDGGATRQGSVAAGFGAIPAVTAKTSAVILHNAASPFTPDALVSACVAGLADFDGMQGYVPSNETTFTHDGTRLEQLIPRAAAGFTCDPTVYRRELVDKISDELSGTGETTLDIATRLGARIGIVESPATNIKITTPGDFERVAAAMGLPTSDD
ncbi:MAG: 2-C-methyl-D-erythritol 4-phosphate cytidylyltransferase [Candidatus Aldehydirespiratoraceae bacterium]